MTDRACLYTGEDSAGRPDYLLLQVPKNLSREFEAAHEQEPTSDTVGTKRRRGNGTSKSSSMRTCFTINGRQGDPAVLCTDKASFSIRQIAQSNSLLLLTPKTDASDSETRLQLRGNLDSMLELVPTVPRLSRIPDLLRLTSYRGPEEETDLHTRLRRGAQKDSKQKLKLYRHRQLRSIVQASEAEFEQALKLFRVIELNSRLRLVASSYRIKVLKMLHAQLMIDTLQPTSVPVQKVVRHLVEDGIAEPIARAVLLRWYGKQVASPDGADSEEVYASLDLDAIVRDWGLELLSIHRAPTSLSTFMNTWRKEVGELFEGSVDLRLLRGNALLHPSPLPTTLFPAPGVVVPASAMGGGSPASGFVPQQVPPSQVQYYPASELQQDAAQRFAELFLTRPHWTHDELLPFIEDMAPGSNGQQSLDTAAAESLRKEQRKVIDGLLMKFTRSRVVKLADAPEVSDTAADVSKDHLAGAGGTAGAGRPGQSSSRRNKAAAAAEAAIKAQAMAKQVCKDTKVYSARMKY
ncbi:Ctf8p and Ctf18p associating protein [Tilletia horrida]|uniref:Ctf8p and Ctf18p associating protein n=1 Tax=Tilletia horrida TaxID=155126 RepID=A0AAN6GIG2_9BASI|nr:Ctf8p and Ctf18p associating protein [Tilletia horrida]KAK0559008.1 Ctf8p and Ctf18p associating protein [Tilletia horrida]